MSARPALAVDNDEPEIKAPTREVVATAVGLTIGLADDRQMQLQSGYADDEPDSVINARLDRAMRFADRQKAKYEIRDLKKELVEINRDLFTGDQGLLAMEDNFRKAEAQLDVQILEVQEKRKEIENTAYQNAAISGRSNKAALKGAPQVNLDRCKKAIEDIQAAKDKNAAEREQALDAASKTQARRRERIEEIHGLIVEKEVLLEGT